MGTYNNFIATRMELGNHYKRVKQRVTDWHEKLGDFQNNEKIMKHIDKS